MTRIAALLLAAALLAPATSLAAGEARYSGDIAATAAGGRELTLEGLGPWKAGGRPWKRVIELGPSTRVERVSRVARPAAGDWPGGFQATPLAAGDLHPGEFVTVAVERHGTKLVAVSVAAVEPHSK